MKARRSPLLVIILLLISALIASQGSATPAEADETEILRLEVRVTDAEGRPVTDLGPRDLELFVDGERLAPTRFRGENGSAAEPVTLVVFVDNLHVGPSRNRALDGLRDFLRQRVRKNDRVILVSFDGQVRLREEVTGDPREIDRVLDRLAIEPSLPQDHEKRVLDDMMSLSDTYSSAGGNNCPFHFEEMAKAHAADVAGRYQVSLGGLSQFIESLASLPGRKAILHLSGGIPLQAGAALYEVLRQYCGGLGEIVKEPKAAAIVTAGRTNPVINYGVYDFRRSELAATSVNASSLLEQLTRQANAHSVTFYPIETPGARNLSASLSHRSLRRTLSRRADEIRSSNLQQSLVTMASATGGRAVLNTDDLAGDLARIGQDLDHFYSLELEQRLGEDRRLFDVRVEARLPGLETRHRPSIRGRSLVEDLAGRTQAALLYDQVSNPLDIGLEVDQTRPMGERHLVPIRLRIPLDKVTLEAADDGHHGLLRVFVSDRDRGGQVSKVRTALVPIVIPSDQLAASKSRFFLYEVKMLMLPGEHKVAIGVHDAVSAIASFMTEQVLVF